jgi:dipeptidyl aminopeptidase/acylaminoacyl peptidase
MKTGIRLIKQCFALGAILFLAACDAKLSPGTIPALTATPSSTKTVPISPSFNTPTVVKSSTSTATITPSTTPTLTSTLRPTPADCDAGFVVFSATTYSSEDQDKTGIYLACADGTYMQKILSATDVFPTAEWVINDLAISPDGQTLAFSSSGSKLVEPAPNQMYLVDISDYSAVDIYSVPDADTFAQLSWSPDGEYIAYRTFNIQTQVSQIEILHINTQTVSMVVDNDPFGVKSDFSCKSGA